MEIAQNKKKALAGMAPVCLRCNDHQPLTVLEQWKASRHWLLWVAVVNRNLDKRDAPFGSSNASVAL